MAKAFSGVFMKYKIGKTEYPVLFAFFSIILTAAYYCIKKHGLFIDEIYSYGLANSHFAPFMLDVFGGEVVDKIITKKDFIDYLTVDASQRFDIGSVFYNQSKDTLPPLYYCLINVVSSFFPGVFSKWIGLSVNCIIYFALLMVLYKTAVSLFGNKRIACAVVMLYGLSEIGLSTFLMIRMYILSAFFTVVATHIVICNCKKEKNSNYILIALTVFLGTMTHYVFTIYAFFLTACYVFYLIINKKISSAVKMSAASLTGIICMFFSFPYVKDQFFSDGFVSGTTAATNFVSFSLWGHRIVRFLFEGAMRSFLAVFIALVIAVFLIIRKKEKTKRRKTNFILVIVSSCLSFFVIAIISPEDNIRYIYNIFPLFVLAVGVLLNDFAHKTSYMIKEKRIYNIAKKTMLPCIVVMSILLLAFFIAPDYVNSSHSRIDNAVSRYSDSACVLFDDNINRPITHNMLQLKQFDEVYIANSVNSKKLEDYLAEKNSENVILFIDTDNEHITSRPFDTEKVINGFLSKYKSYNKATKLYKYGYTVVYLIN